MMNMKKIDPITLDFSRSLGFLIHDVARLLRRAFDRRVKHIGLTRAQWFVLAHLHRADGQTQTALAEELDMERAPLGKLIDRLEDSGWIERRPDPQDRRMKRIFKTSKTDPIMTDMKAVSESVYAQALKGVSTAQREQFIDMLALLKGNLIRSEEENSDCT